MVFGIDASQANRQIRSGTEWYAFYLIRGFARLLGHRDDVKVRLYLRGKPRADLIQNLPENFEIKHLRWPLKYFWAQGRLSLEMLFNPPDVLFSPAHTIPMIHPKETFTTLHDIGFEEFPELYDKLSLWYHRFSARLAVKKAKHIFTISNYTKDRIIEFYNCPEDKISVVYLGYDKQKYRSMEKTEVKPVLAMYGLEYKKYLFYIGRIEPKKNIKGLIEAFGLVQDKSLVLALAGPVIAKPKTENTNVKFLGYIDEADKPALYNGAAVFVFPTFYEGFGMPIVEAQACGVPVVASNTTSSPEVAGEGAMIVNPREPDELADMFSDLIKNKTLQDQLIKKGFENTNRFSWKKTAEKTLGKLGLMV